MIAIKSLTRIGPNRIGWRAVSGTADRLMKKPTLLVDRDLTLADEPVAISIAGLGANQKVTLHASAALPNGIAFESFSHYVADETGSIELDKSRSTGGSYTGIEPMGPFWSMVPSPLNERRHERFLVKEPSEPFQVNLALHEGLVGTLEEIAATSRDSELVKTTLSRSYMAPGVQEFDVREGRVRGTLYLPPGEGPFPGVISMSGGYPGAMKHKASLLASRGFAAIALKYFGVEDLPSDAVKDIDLVYFEEAATLLKNHPKVYGKNGIGIIANCYGGTVALAFAGFAPPGLVNCVVGISSVIYGLDEFRYHGQRLKLSPGVNLNVIDGPEGSIAWSFHDNSRITKEDLLPFYKRRDISYMLVYGEKDAYYSAEWVANFARNALDSEGHENYDILFYHGAGHLIEHAFCPMSRILWTFSQHHFLGGEQPLHAKAEIDSWPKILAFVRNSIRND